MLDVAAVVRGASRGFTVFLVGELAAVLVSLASTGVGGILFALTAAAAPVTAGIVAVRSGDWQGRNLAAGGAAAGLAAYALTVPLRLLGPGLSGSEVAFSVVASVVLGAGATRVRSA